MPDERAVAAVMAAPSSWLPGLSKLALAVMTCILIIWEIEHRQTGSAVMPKRSSSSGVTDDATQVATENPLAALDSALSDVDSLRSEMGAMQNRFDSAITNLSTTETNLSAARSRIEDADYAVEVSNMTRAQILQQAGTSVLAQANQVPQSVLSLLG